MTEAQQGGGDFIARFRDVFPGATEDWIWREYDRLVGKPILQFVGELRTLGVGVIQGADMSSLATAISRGGVIGIVAHHPCVALGETGVLDADGLLAAVSNPKSDAD